jgi:glycosyltransferase involved in cell wall biosynthesis
MIPATLGRCRVSALMSTYSRENAQWLSEALESIFAQTVPPDQLVLVLDGEVGDDQEAVISHYKGDPRVSIVDIVKLPRNKGLANALNAGLAVCAGEWIMRMDADDRARVNRLAVQLDYIEAHPDTDILSTWCEEFSDEDDKKQIRTSPTEHNAIVQALRWRNIIAHQTILMRTEVLRRIGGYRADFGMLEDYDLFVRSAMAGARFHIIPAALLLCRRSRALYVRRGGWRYLLGELRFRVFCFRSGFLNARQFFAITAAYSLFRLIGGSLRMTLYQFVRIPQA